MAYNNEADRQSAVSSFYRGRKDSFDALGGAANPTRVAGVHHDDASSFFQPNLAGGGNNRFSRGSGDMLVTQGQGSAGYNRDSFFDPGRSMPVRGGRDEEEGMGSMRGAARDGQPIDTPEVEDPGWDVYNDFNNVGPRYSEAFGNGLSSLSTANSNGYRQIPATHDSLPPKSELGANDDNVEMVTVPALGPDWKKSEIENMRKATKRNEKNEERMRVMKSWWRDQHGCCGGFGNRKTIAISLFVLCFIIGIILAITIPRVPGFAFNAQTPLSNDTSSSLPSEFSRAPANFSFPALLNIQIDTHSNIIPLKVNNIQAAVFSLDTDVPVGSGLFSGITIPAKTFQPVSIPVVFNYTAHNDTDTTWLLFYNACRNRSQYTDGVRPGFNLRVLLTASIAGMIHKVLAPTQITKVGCPFELSNSSV